MKKSTIGILAQSMPVELPVAMMLDEGLSEITSSMSPKEAKILEFTRDPMIDVVTMLRMKWNYSEIYSTINDIGSKAGRARISTGNFAQRYISTDEDVQRAKAIRYHFKNKLVFKHLQDLPLSQFQKDLDDILSDNLKLKLGNLAAFIKLPAFFDEDKQTAEIFKNHKSINSERYAVHVDEVVTFAGSVDRNSRDGKHVTFYWTTRLGFLLAVKAPRSTNAYASWKFISELGQVGIRGEAMIAPKVGTDFRVGYLRGTGYELYHERD